jgi:tetratricopeptide (TPR) repeat protein
MCRNLQRVGFLLLTALLFFACTRLRAQSGAPKGNSKVPSMDEAKTHRDAMVPFKKAEAMIGTPKENSNEQAELFLKAIQIQPDFLEAHYNLGLIYSNQKKIREAAAEFEKVLKINPKFDALIYLMMASAYQEIDESQSAMSALEAGLQRNPKDLTMLRPLASLQFHSKNEMAALRSLQQILEIDPADVSSRIDLALLFQKSGELEKAISNYEEVLRLDSKSFVARYNLGLIFLRQKKMAEAAEQLEAANQIRPGNAEILERLGDIYVFEKQHAKAVSAYKSALEKDKGNSVVYGKLGFSLANLNQPDAAVAALENSAHLNPKIPDTFSLLGDLYIDLKRNDEAIAAYRKSLALNSQQKDVHYNLGTLYAEQKKLDEAMAELKFAVQLDPEYAAAWANLALVAEQLDLDKDALQAHEKMIALGKAKPQTYFHLGVLYAKSDQPDLSITNFTRAIELDPDKYRAMLREELIKVHSVLDSVRYKEKFIRLLALPSAK